MTATAAFRAALGAAPTATEAAGLLGLEHEYQLSCDAGTADFRELIHSLPIPGRRLDPGDSHAYRCPSGLAVTCDDAEAEIASPPVPLGPDFTRQVDAWAHAGHGLLASLLPAGVALHGFSTHLSAAVPDAQAERVAQSFARTFAPAVMLMLDRPGSHGVFVRPRPERLELCGDYAIGERLRAVTAFFAGAVRACTTGSGLPPALGVKLLAAPGRYGIELDSRLAFGFDFYRRNREADLPRAGGGTVRAQQYLAEAWEVSRAALHGYTAGDDLAACDRMIQGSSPLGVEAATDDSPLAVRAPAPTPFGDLLVPRARPGYSVSAAVATWAFTVFELAGSDRTGYASVPRPLLGVFLTHLDAGALDPILGGFLRTAPSGLRLADVSQTRHPGLWNALSVSTRLLAHEPGPALSAESKPDRPSGPRPGKRPVAAPPPPPPPPFEPSPPVPVMELGLSSTEPEPVDHSPTEADTEEPDLGSLLRVEPELVVPYQPPIPAAWETPDPEPTGEGKPATEVDAEPDPDPGPDPDSERHTGVVLTRCDREPRGRRSRTGTALLVVAILGGIGIGAYGLLGGQEPTVEVISTTVQPPSTRVAPSTTGVTVTTPSTTPSTTPGSTSATSAVLRPTIVTTTVPTTVPRPTVPPSSTTSTTVPFVVKVGGGCDFNLPSALPVKGSELRFENTGPDTVEIMGRDPSNVEIKPFTLTPNQLSGLYPLSMSGPYSFVCRTIGILGAAGQQRELTIVV